MIRIKRDMNSTYEDGSHWVEYKTEDGHFGYELLDKGKKLHMVERKPNLSECSKVMQELIENVLETENEMWFVEYDDVLELMEDYNLLYCEVIDNIKSDAVMYDLEDYIRFGEDDCEVTIYGGIITKFEF